MAPRRPGILVIGLPRSGTSWVGDTLGRSAGALYLREPLNQSYLARVEKGPSVFEIDPEDPPAAYVESAEHAFAGRPAFRRKIVPYPRQWWPWRRSRRRPVVKEINPLALPWIVATHAPRVIHLVRHPAAVARSFHARDWTRHPLDRFSPETLAAEGVDPGALDGFWPKHGAMQAIVHRRAVAALDGVDATRIRYEDLCVHPVALFRELFGFAELPWSRRIEQEVEARSTGASDYRAGAYSLERDSAAMVDRWRKELPTEAVAGIRDAYLALDPPVYGADDW